ncbi:hypothetical protein [Dysgonomonas sp.]
MARWTKEIRERKISHAKQLYCKGFDSQTIADIIEDVQPSTVDEWIRVYEFDKSKQSQIIALSEIRGSILESYAALLDGQTPKITPDQAAKYATAFEKFSSKKQVLTYMHEAYEMLCEEYMKDIQKAEKKKDKETLLCNLRVTRSVMEKVLTRLTNEVIGHD